MDTIRHLVIENRTAAIALVIFLFAVSALILKKYRILAVVFVFIASLLTYLLMYTNAVKAPNIEKLKERTKEKVMQKIK